MDAIEFKIPRVPPSVNSLYNVMFALRRVEMKPDVRRYKTEMKVYVPAFPVEKNAVISLEFEIVQEWICKNGNWKKQDVQNMLKVLIDLVAEKQGWDDSQVWYVNARKIESKTEMYVRVKESKVFAVEAGSALKASALQKESNRENSND